MKTHDRPIARADLARSKGACHRIEDELWRRLARLNCTTRSNAASIAVAIRAASGEVPDWCEREAWDAIASGFVRWSRVFGDLRTFVELRNKKDD